MSPWVYVLGVSLAANVALGAGFLSARDDVAAGEARYKQKAADALACSDATEDLFEAGARRKAEGAKAIAVARATALSWEQRANAERGRPQAVPGDACASAALENREWLEKRRAGQ